MQIKSSNPLYYTIKEDIKNQINNKEFNPGDFIPTESDLCEKYKVSRVTIRRAIEELVEEGVLIKDRGKTAYVANKAIPRSLNRLGGLHEELTKAGIKCASYILNSETVKAEEWIAKKMEIDIDTLLYRFERLRYADGNPVCYQIVYLVKSLCEDINIRELATSSLYETIEHKFHLKIDYAEQTISSVLSTYKQSALLELPERTCMLCVKRTTFLEGTKCIEYSESYYVGNRYSLTMTLHR